MKDYGLRKAANRAWSATKSITQRTSGEAKATTAGAAAGGAVAAIAGTHVGIAAFGTAISGAALLPVAVTVGVGAVAGYAAYKGYKDFRARQAQRAGSTPTQITDSKDYKK